MITSQNNYGPNLLSRLLDASSVQQIEAYAKAAWILNGEGLIADADMDYLAPVIEHRRNMKCSSNCSYRRNAGKSWNHPRPVIAPARRAGALLQRRRLAKDCVMPTSLVQNFTTGKLAVLAVIAYAVIDRGYSDLSLSEIAVRAGVGCTTARYAIREAVRLGLLSVQENRHNETWSRPNTIRIICRRWLRWLAGHLRSKTRDTSEAAKVTPNPLRNVIPTTETKRFNMTRDRVIIPDDGALLSRIGVGSTSGRSWSRP